MGKNRLLDIVDKAAIAEGFGVCDMFPDRDGPGGRGAEGSTCSGFCTDDRMTRWMRNGTYLLSLVLFSLLVGCSLPRIVVLDDPLSPEEHLNLGVAYEKNGELDYAVKEYETASKKLPEAYLYLGNVYLVQKDFEKAELSYKKAIKKKPEIADAYNNLAWLYYVKRQNLEEAENLARKAISLNPRKAVIYQDTLDKIEELKSSE